MAQVLVRNLPDEVKARLQRRAERHGRSLEAEVRAILTGVPETEPRKNKKEGLGTTLSRKLAKHTIDDEAWKAFDANIEELRKNWRVRDVDFDG